MPKAQSAVPSESGPPLATANTPARRHGEYVSTGHGQVPVALAALCRRPAAELEAATRLVQVYELRADHWEGEMPLWGGWALHEAFLLGAAWKERHG